jgi:hypothetical protein
MLADVHKIVARMRSKWCSKRKPLSKPSMTKSEQAFYQKGKKSVCEIKIDATDMLESMEWQLIELRKRVSSECS